MEIYNNDKIIFHSDRLRELKKEGHTSPIHVNFILSNVCNHNCLFCSYRMENYPTSQMFYPKSQIEKNKAKEIIYGLKELGTRAIQFTGGGEPLTHPFFYDILEYTQGLNIDTSLVTNGQKLDDDIIRIIINSQWIRISLDAGTPETHNRNHRAGEKSFNKIVSNISNLVSFRAKTNSKLYIGIGFVITKENYKEILAGTLIVKNIGADSIRFSTVYSNESEKYYEGLVEKIEYELMKANHLQDDKFQVISSFEERYNDLSQGRPDYDICYQQRVSSYIGADLNVYRCCVTSYNNLGLLGSIKDKNIVDFWNSKELINKLNKFDPKSCIRCQFHGKNRIIKSVMENLNSGHINFV